MNSKRIALALNTLSLGFAELAEAIQDDGNQIGHLAEPIEPVAAGAVPSPRAAAVEQVLGECPVHQTAWVLKEAGVSTKTGKKYSAFWKCDGKNADGSFCQKKPALEWVRTHDPEQVSF